VHSYQRTAAAQLSSRVRVSRPHYPAEQAARGSFYSKELCVQKIRLSSEDLKSERECSDFTSIRLDQCMSLDLSAYLYSGRAMPGRKTSTLDRERTLRVDFTKTLGDGPALPKENCWNFYGHSLPDSASSRSEGAIRGLIGQ
jgi:hypothetical protein